MTPTKYHPPSVATSHGGFTLIELMIVIVIAAILVAIAAPGFRDAIEKGQVKDATEAVFGTIAQAKAEMSSRDMDMYLDVNEGTSWCIGYIPKPTSATTCDCGTANSCVVEIGGTNNVSTVLDNTVDFTDVTIDFGSISGGAFDGSSTWPGTTFDHVRKSHGTGTIQVKSDSGDWEAFIVASGYRIRVCTLDNGKGITGYPTC